MRANGVPLPVMERLGVTVGEAVVDGPGDGVTVALGEAEGLGLAVMLGLSVAVPA